MNVSSTTWLLLKYAKSNRPADEVFNYKSVKRVLVNRYHPDMQLYDVMSILLSVVTDVQNEPRFELHYGSEFLNRCLLSPLKTPLFLEDAPSTPEEVYDNIIREIMYGLRFTRVDWCREQLQITEEV